MKLGVGVFCIGMRSQFSALLKMDVDCTTITNRIEVPSSKSLFGIVSVESRDIFEKCP